MLVWRSADRDLLQLGKARSFIEVFMSGRETRYLAMADKFRHTSGFLWSQPPAGQQPVLVSIECFLGNFPWVDFGNVVEILVGVLPPFELTGDRPLLVETFRPY